MITRIGVLSAAVATAALFTGLFLLAGATHPARAGTRNPIEICGNGLDDDGDGTIDEIPNAGGCTSGPGEPTSDKGVIPEEWTDNPTCADLGYSYEFKLAGAVTGTFTFTSVDGTLTGGAPEDP